MPELSSDTQDGFDLARFLAAQAGTYAQAVHELRAGQKRSHWMWFIFPQMDGLGASSTARHYAIKSLPEASEYLRHPVLGARIAECARIVNGLEGRSATQIFGIPDNMKFRSSMTLFELVAGPGSEFAGALNKYFAGERDARTLELACRPGNEKEPRQMPDPDSERTVRERRHACRFTPAQSSAIS